jgi:hypothetical protein
MTPRFIASDWHALRSISGQSSSPEDVAAVDPRIRVLRVEADGFVERRDRLVETAELVEDVPSIRPGHRIRAITLDRVVGRAEGLGQS